MPKNQRRKETRAYGASRKSKTEHREEKMNTAMEKITDVDKNIEIARSAYEAYLKKDRVGIEKLIAADFHSRVRSITALIARHILRGAGQTASGSTVSSLRISSPTATEFS
jgi:hypothetical protein